MQCIFLAYLTWCMMSSWCVHLTLVFKFDGLSHLLNQCIHIMFTHPLSFYCFTKLHVVKCLPLSLWASCHVWVYSHFDLSIYHRLCVWGPLLPCLIYFHISVNNNLVTAFWNMKRKKLLYNLDMKQNVMFIQHLKRSGLETKLPRKLYLNYQIWIFVSCIDG